MPPAVSGDIRLIAPTREALDTLIAAVGAACGEAVTFRTPMPALTGWRVYGVLRLLVRIGNAAIIQTDDGK